MKRIIYFILSAVLLSISSCNKENQRIGEITYELDSVVESYLDTLGNEYPSMRRTIIASSDYVNNLPRSYAGYYHEVYAERNDSILIQNFSEITCGSGAADYNYLINGRFHSLYHEKVEFCNHDIYFRFFQYVNYNSDNKLSGIVYRNMDVGGLHEQSDWPKEGYYRNKFQESIIINYSDNNINSVDYNSVAFNNSTTDSVVNHSVLTYGYSHHYENQKDLIGIDINDIILSTYLMALATKNMTYNPFGDNNNVALNSFNIPLIINKKATFNTNCKNLIEEFSNPFYGYGIGNTYTTIQYEFDNNHNGRIKSMVIYDGLKYTFYYKN